MGLYHSVQAVAGASGDGPIDWSAVAAAAKSSTDPGSLALTERQEQAYADDVRDARDRVREVADMGFDLPETVEIQSGDSVWFALRELLENAVSHSEQAEPEISVTVEETDTEVAVEIVDDGPGIPKSEQQAFEDATETSTDHAIGIGLWLVRWAVDTAGGTLDYAEADPHGSIVTVRLPSVSNPLSETNG